MTSYIPPLGTQTFYDIPGGSIVKVLCHNKDEFLGTVYINPASTENSSGIQLLRTTNLKNDFFLKDVIKLYSTEIRHVTIIKQYKPEVKQVETCMLTYVVENEEQLKMLVKALDGVDEVGMSFVGEVGGRFGYIAWIMLAIKNVLLPVNVLELDKITKNCAWKALKKTLFENEDILKIVHDCRPMADYLYHLQVITLKNVFDTQVGDLLIKVRNMKLREKEFKDKRPANIPLRNITLAECLAQYIPAVVLERELALMNLYYPKELDVKGPLVQKPVPDKNARKYAALTVKYLCMVKKIMAEYILEKPRKCFDGTVQLAIENSMAEAKIQIQVPERIPKKLINLLGRAPEPSPPYDEANRDPSAHSNEVSVCKK